MQGNAKPCKGLLQHLSDRKHNPCEIASDSAIGWNGGTDAQTIVEGIEATEDVPGRMHVIDEEQPFGVIVDSAGTPSALSRLLDDVRDLQFMPRLIGGRIGTKVRRIILVVGVKGDAPPAMRPLVGEVAHWKVCCSQ